jgi:hypothetical protein
MPSAAPALQEQSENYESNAPTAKSGAVAVTAASSVLRGNEDSHTVQCARWHWTAQRVSTAQHRVSEDAMTGKISRNHSAGPLWKRLFVYSFLLVLIPLVLYPKPFGFPPFDLNPAVGLLEWAFYAAVFSLTAARLPFSTKIVAAGFTVVYRLAVGALSGCVIGWVHGQPLPQTVIETMWSYPMALIPQVLTSAVITGPLWEHLMSSRPTRRVASRKGRPTFVKPAGGSTMVFAPSASASRVASSSNALNQDPSFDDAVSYVGEYTGVRLCWIVDRDGLPIAVWQRQHYTGDADFWAPVSVEMMDFHRRRLSIRNEVCQPDRLEVRTNQGRLVVEAVRDVWLGVLTDTDADELISVRIARAHDMIAKHLHTEGGQLVSAGEVQYV